jgi:hypothetical protein
MSLLRIVLTGLCDATINDAVPLGGLSSWSAIEDTRIPARA